MEKRISKEITVNTTYDDAAQKLVLSYCVDVHLLPDKKYMVAASMFLIVPLAVVTVQSSNQVSLKRARGAGPALVPGSSMIQSASTLASAEPLLIGM